MCQGNCGALRIVDFGGGLGVAYAHLLRTLRKSQRLEYHVVDLPWACEDGSRIFAGDSNVHFHRPWPEPLPDVDIVCAASALQYVENYAEVIKRLCEYRATYLLLVDMHVGDFPTYASAQLDVPGTVFPLWFANRDEIVRIVSGGGYDLIFDGAMPDRSDQDNFPQQLRLHNGQRRVFLFASSSRTTRRDS